MPRGSGLAYADAIPLDLLRSEQDRIAREQLAAQREQAAAEGTAELVADTYRHAARLMQQGATIYAHATDEARRPSKR